MKLYIYISCLSLATIYGLMHKAVYFVLTGIINMGAMVVNNSKDA